MDSNSIDNRYYVPDISEFYIGFEYEFKHPDFDDWNTYILSEDNLSPELDDSPFGYSNLDGIFRVKYLDTESILSLGFIQDENYKCPFTGKSGNRFHRTDESVGFNNGLYFTITLGGGSMIQLEYAYYSSYSNPAGRLQMNVKNKSELSKLLNQFSN